MSHAVHFRSGDGSTTFEPLGSLDEALARVERLRNEEGVSEVRVYREVPVTFRTYYKATVAEEGTSAPTDEAPAAAPEPPPAPQRPTSSPTSSPADPPPGAMPLNPPPTPPATPSDVADDEGPVVEEAEPASGRGSLFSRG